MRSLRWLVGAAAMTATSVQAVAHDTGVAHDEPPGWTLDPLIVLPLLIALAAFATGWRRLTRRWRRGEHALRRSAKWFGSGWLILAAALVSPLHEAGERSFSAHMFEHELIMLVAAPLLVLSQPLAILLWAFPTGLRKRIGALAAAHAVQRAWRTASAPVFATVAQAAALWLWHAPALFDLALSSEGWHAAQHLSFIVTALLFWTAMLGRRTAPGMAALCLIVTSIVSGALGALMTFATSPWYAGYARFAFALFGMSAVEDQQVAGLLMWVPGGLVHAGAALVIVRRLLRPAHA